MRCIIVQKVDLNQTGVFSSGLVLLLLALYPNNHRTLTSIVVQWLKRHRLEE